MNFAKDNLHVLLFSKWTSLTQFEFSDGAEMLRKHIENGIFLVVIFALVTLIVFLLHQPEERKWDDVAYESRWYHTAVDPSGTITLRSVFADGSQTITVDQLNKEWPNWSHGDRIDFSASFSDSAVRINNADEILRFLLANGDSQTNSNIAINVAEMLPAYEAFALLSEWCTTCEVGNRASYFHAIGYVDDERKQEVLGQCLDQISTHPSLFDKTESGYGVAIEATYFAEAMLRCGVKIDKATQLIRALSIEHPQKPIRERCRRLLDPDARLVDH